MSENIDQPESENFDGQTFVEGLDFYFEEGLMVLTARFLRNRGYCCRSGCRHCPYTDEERLRDSK
jgi:hypothetical protein